MIGVTSMLFHQIFDGGNSRSVVTVAGQLPALEEAVLAAAKVFFEDNFILIWMMAFMIIGMLFLRRGVQMSMFAQGSLFMQEAFMKIDLGSHEGGHPRQVSTHIGRYVMLCLGRECRYRRLENPGIAKKEGGGLTHAKIFWWICRGIPKTLTVLSRVITQVK